MSSQGKVLLIEAVMDTAVHGPEVDTAYLLETEDTDGGGGQKLPFYQDIASCNIEVSRAMSAHHLMQLDIAVERSDVFAEMYICKKCYISYPITGTEGSSLFCCYSQPQVEKRLWLPAWV